MPDDKGKTALEKKYESLRCGPVPLLKEELRFEDAVKTIAEWTHATPSRVLQIAEKVGEIKGCHISESVAFLYALSKILHEEIESESHRQ